MKNSSITSHTSSLVSLVGAGPGDPKLLTIRGREVLEKADVVFYDALIGDAILRWAREDAEKIFVGKRAGAHALTQDEINALIIQKAREGKTICRLKGGDPFVFGRGGEEALACVQNQIPFEIVPGISSAIAAPAYAGIPVTHRDVATSFAVVTGHTKTDDAPPENLPRADTLIFLMGVRALPKIVESVKAQGRVGSTPVALVRWGTTSQQKVVVGNLDTIVEDVERAALKPPALIVVGDVVRLRDELSWFDDPNRKPLLGQTIVVTRAREQASTLVEGLENLGANILQCPTIRIEKLSEAEYSLLDDAIEKIADFDWIVFASRNGVQHFWQRLRQQRKDARALAGARVAAIGPATQEALKAIGIAPDFVPESSISESVAEGLLQFSPRNVLLVRATEGRDVMQNVWRDSGAQVTLAPTYRTVPDNSDAQNVREKIADGAVDWITFTSSSTVTNFIQAIGAEVLQRNRAHFRVACIGPITEKTAHENGLVPDVVAEQASVESLVESLIAIA